jgi:hypothetical protein
VLGKSVGLHNDRFVQKEVEGGGILWRCRVAASTSWSKGSDVIVAVGLSLRVWMEGMPGVDDVKGAGVGTEGL